MAVQRITKAVVDRLAPGETVWDEDVRGFGVRRQRRDATYVLKVRIGGQQRFFTVGRHGAPWTPDEARKEARRLLGEIAVGNDPAAVRDSEKAVPTLADFGTTYLAQYAKVHKKPRSVEDDRRNLDYHIVPALGRYRLSDITPRMVSEFHARMSDKPVAANRS